MDRPAPQITQLLRAWSEGDQSALDQLMPIVYENLHRLAQSYMAQERPDHTLQATSLVHETYLRLLDSAHPSWQDRAHFFADGCSTRGSRDTLISGDTRCARNPHGDDVGEGQLQPF
jgi:hypothetical protein